MLQDNNSIKKNRSAIYYLDNKYKCKDPSYIGRVDVFSKARLTDIFWKFDPKYKLGLPVIKQLIL